MKRILLTSFLLTQSSFAFAADIENLSFYVGAGVSYVGPGSLTFDGYDLEGTPFGQFIGVDLNRGQTFYGLEYNRLQPHCDYYNNYGGPCGQNNQQGIGENDRAYSYMDLADIKLRVGRNFEGSKAYFIAGGSIGRYDFDETTGPSGEQYYGASGYLIGAGFEYELFKNFSAGGEFIARSIRIEGEADRSQLSTFQVRTLYRF